MLSFKAYLTENKPFIRKTPLHDGRLMHDHIHPNVAGHHVQTSFIPKGPGKHYDITFAVNGLEHKEDPHRGAEGHQILRHVTGVIDSFVKEHRPESIGFNANVPVKNAAYHTFAGMIAKRYGAEHESVPHMAFPDVVKHIVRFKK